MFKTDRYVITPFVNNSFDFTMKELIGYFISNYLIEKCERYNISYDSKCVIDNTKVGSLFGPNLKRPDKIYVTVSFMNNNSWTNGGGGLKYCTILFVDRIGTEKINIRWDTIRSGDNVNHYYYKEISIKQIRKLKLEKINKYENT